MSKKYALGASYRAANWVALFCFVWVIGMAATKTADAEPQPTDVLWLETASGVHEIRIEVAKTLAEKAKGLMFRTQLAPGRGMFFPYEQPENHAMWMRNTYIPLDMVFIKSDGRVHRIEAQTEPFSEKIIHAGAEVTGVLEIAGGEAARLGLKSGDLVRHSWFGTAKTN